MRFLVALVLVALVSTPLHAQEFKRNAWGVVFAPMQYGLKEGQQFETDVFNAAMGVGLFYARFIRPGFSGRIEVIGQGRQVNTFVSDASGGNPGFLYSLEETGFTATVAFFGDDRFDLSGHAARFSYGAGLTVTGVTDQEFGAPRLDVTDYPEGGEYGAVGYLLDAGMYLQVKRTTSVFTRFRYQEDASTFGVSSTETAREYAAFGFLVGAEFGF